MSKKILGIALAIVAFASLLPAFVMSYGVLFGHNYTTNQADAAAMLFVGGIFAALLAAFVWSDIV